MITFAAPWDTMALQVTVKSPEFSDAQEPLVPTQVMVMMNGSLRTRVQSPDPTKLVLDFIELSRNKAIELRDFMVASLGKKMRYVDYDGVHWVGQVTVEPSMVTTGRGGGSSPRQESCSIKVEFEGNKL